MVSLRNMAVIISNLDCKVVIFDLVFIFTGLSTTLVILIVQIVKNARAFVKLKLHLKMVSGTVYYEV